MISEELRKLLFELDNDEITEVYGILKGRRDFLTRIKATQFRYGDKVSFLTKKRERVYGTVLCAMQKNVRIRTGEHQVWKVAASLLRKEE